MAEEERLNGGGLTSSGESKGKEPEIRREEEPTNPGELPRPLPYSTHIIT